MQGLGKSGYPEKNPTHVYISLQHFNELEQLLNDMMHNEMEYPGNTKKWIKFVQCHWERDMYQREPVHTDVSSYCPCRSYFDNLEHKAIWWFEFGTNKFIRMTFKEVSNDNMTFNCCLFWIKIFGLFELELKVENASDGEGIRRSFRVVCKE